MVFRLIAPEWALTSGKIKKKTLEGQFNEADLRMLNEQGYNVYYFVNQPDSVDTNKPVDGSLITKFDWVFVDMDLKDGVYSSKTEFVADLISMDLQPTKIVDSGNGVHVYWKVTNLDAMSYLRFQRRLMRLLHTDEAVSKICQLMRYPGMYNTKSEAKVLCKIEQECDKIYTAEELDRLLPTITKEDELFCRQHHDRTYNLNQNLPLVSDKLPEKFGRLLKTNAEAKNLWIGPNEDRSMADWRLGQLMHAMDFTRNEAITVLAQTAKALQRSPTHRASYAQTIVDKLWTFDEEVNRELSDDNDPILSKSIRDILKKNSEAEHGLKFQCHPMIDGTYRGFRLGDVMGLVGGSGIGKTAFTMNIFKWFAERNPDYHHIFVSLEQPGSEIAERWVSLCGEDSSLHDKVHVINNYDDNGNFLHLSLHDIKEYVKKFQEKNSCKVGCVVIDHIGALKKKGADDENKGIMDICHEMKSFAIETNTFLIMQSQTSREKAGIGDLELDKDAAYGTTVFEWYCDYLVTIWQPLKRMHNIEACPTVTAYKFCKIRHKKPKKDKVQEDVAYRCFFDTETERLRELTEDERKSFTYYLPKAMNKRSLDRKISIGEYKDNESASYIRNNRKS